MNKLIRAFWFITLFVTLGVLLFTYASFSEAQLIDMQNALYNISREAFFYLALSIITLSNFTLYILARKLKHHESRQALFIYGWLLSFAVVLNFFFIVAMAFVQVTNTGERFDVTYIGYLIYSALVVIGLWVLVFPLYFIKLKITS